MSNHLKADTTMTPSKHTKRYMECSHNGASKALITFIIKELRSTSSPHCTFTNETQQSEPYACSKTISSVVYVRWTEMSPLIYGAACWTKQNSPSACYVHPGSIKTYQLTNSSMVSMISVQHPLAPPGTKCIAHEKSSQRGTWAPHGQLRWYIGGVPEHYRYYQIYIPKTQGTHICDTVEFFPTHCKMPNATSHDAVIYAANDLITTLTTPQPTNSVLSIGNDQLEALQKISHHFSVLNPNRILTWLTANPPGVWPQNTPTQWV